MKKHYLIPLFIVMISVLLIGCAGEKVKPTPPAFQPYKFQANQYEPKVDNFMVILDTSSSMADKYQGQAKDTIAKNFLMAMNQTNITVHFEHSATVAIYRTDRPCWYMT